jgi:hypothetical protein
MPLEISQDTLSDWLPIDWRSSKPEFLKKSGCHSLRVGGASKQLDGTSICYSRYLIGAYALKAK